MAVSFVFPITGLGVDLCPFHRATGLPCPGCGMSRAMAAMSQGDLGAALGLHPFVVFAWPAFLVLALLAVAPSGLTARVERALDRHGESLTRGYRVVFTAFLGFGVLRLLVVLTLQTPFP